MKERKKVVRLEEQTRKTARETSLLEAIEYGRTIRGEGLHGCQMVYSLSMWRRDERNPPAGNAASHGSRSRMEGTMLALEGEERVRSTRAYLADTVAKRMRKDAGW